MFTVFGIVFFALVARISRYVSLASLIGMAMFFVEFLIWGFLGWLPLNGTDLVEGTVATVEKDANGNVTLDEVEEYGINEETSVYEKMGGSRYIYTYDPEHDNAMLTMQYEEYDSETKEYVPFARVTTTEFVSVSTGINNVKVQSVDDASAVYTLQGVKTNAAGKGLYIVKRNGKFVKVMK